MSSLRRISRLLRLRNIIALALLTAAGLSVLLVMRSREPHYLGHPISYWTEPWHHHGTETPEREAAAFAEMDERAVRWLARELGWRPSRIREGFGRCMNSLFGDFMEDRDYDGGRRASSIRALTRLGPRARSAIPALEAASRTPTELNQTSIRAEALGALIRIRGQDVLPYIESLKTAQGNDWTILTYALAAQGTNAALAAPILADAVRSTNLNRWRAPAIYALGEIRSYPEAGVPALIHCLEITNRIERQMTLEALWKFGPDAIAAYPALLICLSNSDQRAAAQLKRVLQKIDPHRAETLGF